MHRIQVTNVKFVAFLLLSVVGHIGQALAQTPSSLFQRIPVSFEENRGQFADDSRFLIHAANARINMKATQLEIYRTPKLPDLKAKPLNDEPQVVAPPIVMSFVNANSKAVATPSEESPRKSHYIFNDGGLMPKVITAKHFRSVRVASLYPGIDAVYYDKAGEIEYDLIVQPNADAKQVRLDFGGAATTIDREGNIKISADGETVIHRSPVVYQGDARSKNNVGSRYFRNRDGTFGIELGKHDTSKALTIDPVISFITSLSGQSGSINQISDITTDSVGRVLAVGQTDSFDFPLRNNILPNPPSAVTAAATLGFVTRLNVSGSDIEFSTFVAASATSAIRLDTKGNIYVVAKANDRTGTLSAGLNAYKSTGSGSYILKLSPNGDAILGATYLGSADSVTLAVNDSGSVAVNGTGSVITTSGAWFASSAASNGFVAKLQPTLSAADFVTYVPAAPQIKGVFAFNQDGSLSTGGAIEIDASGNVYIAGGTNSATYPVTAGAFQTIKKDNLDVFVTKLSPSGTLLLSTFVGSNQSAGTCFSGDDWATGIVVGADGGIYVGGKTMSSYGPAIDNPFTSSRYAEWNVRTSFNASEDSRAFMFKLAPDFTSLIFSGSIITDSIYHSPQGSSTLRDCFYTYGGMNTTVALDNNQNAYLLAGHEGNLFPATDAITAYGHTALIVNSKGQRIGATKLANQVSTYALNPATGALYFVAGSIQPTTSLIDSRGPLLMKVISPLARMSLTGNVNPANLGQAITLTATAMSVPAGGTFILKRDGLEVARTPAISTTTTFTVSDLQIGFYAFTVGYELPDLAGTVTSKTLAQTIVQTAVCP